MTGERRVVALEPAFVLHSRPYRDSSAIIEAFTEHHGRVGLVGRGIRGQRSKLRGVVQPFTGLLLSWSGRGDLATLTGAEMREAPLHFPGARIAAAFYLNELIIRLVRREDPHPDLYDAYVTALVDLAANREPELALRLFEKRLLEEIGYGLTLDHDVQGEPVQADARYEVPLDGLPLRVESTAAGTNIFAGRSLLALASGALPDRGAAQDAKRLLRAALEPHLGPRPLKSRELYRQMAAVARPTSRDDAEGLP